MHSRSAQSPGPPVRRSAASNSSPLTCFALLIAVACALTLFATKPHTATADDCTPINSALIDSEPEDGEPPGFIDFNLCDGDHAIEPTGTFLMAVHVASPGASYSEHETWLLEASDAENWTLVPGFEGFTGSVPDVITRDSEIILYNPGKMRSYDLASGRVRGKTVTIRDAEGETVRYVDPSAILDDTGRIVLFFLNSTGTPMGQDPAAGSNPKDFDSAVEVEGSEGSEFLLSEGHRLQIQGSDPDIFFDGEQFVLYISRGQSTLAFISDTLEGEYTAIAGLEGDSFLSHQGGIPAGHYDEDSGLYWTYVHANTEAGTVVKLATHEFLSNTLGEHDFTTLLAGGDMGYDSDHGVESPSFAVHTAVPEAGASGAALCSLIALCVLARRRDAQA